jgi:formate dehydrogenase iron-sulfur subunit
VYGLPPDPHVPTRDAKSMWRRAVAAAGVFALAGIGAFVSSAVGGRR